MPAFTMSAARIFAGLAASALFTPTFCAAASLVINSETPLNITTPPGFTYVVTGSDGSLSVPTDGFLFCANLSSDETEQPPSTPVTVMPQHGDWALPVAQDVQTVAYNNGALVVNHSLLSTLICHAVGAGGETRSALADGIFRNGNETKTFEQYSNLINWIAPQGFDWDAPIWSQVPTDPCSPSVNQPAQTVENVACAAVSGARPAGAGATTRAATMWTATDGASFFYVARVDARFGAQNEADGTDPQLPTNLNGGSEPESAGNVRLKLVEAYDRGVIGVGGGYLGDIGLWCVMTALPTALNGNMCAGAPASGLLNGPLTDFPTISLNVPPLGIPRVSYYIAFIRPIVGPPPASNEPAAAVSILLETSVSVEGGDEFRGDDVVFAFLPTSLGFPWMSGGQ
jgi:hypothetical protein